MNYLTQFKSISNATYGKISYLYAKNINHYESVSSISLLNATYSFCQAISGAKRSKQSRGQKKSQAEDGPKNCPKQSLRPIFSKHSVGSNNSQAVWGQKSPKQSVGQKKLCPAIFEAKKCHAICGPKFVPNNLWGQHCFSQSVGSKIIQSSLLGQKVPSNLWRQNVQFC